MKDVVVYGEPIEITQINNWPDILDFRSREFVEEMLSQLALDTIVVPEGECAKTMEALAQEYLSDPLTTREEAWLEACTQIAAYGEIVAAARPAEKLGPRTFRIELRLGGDDPAAIVINADTELRYGIVRQGVPAGYGTLAQRSAIESLLEHLAAEGVAVDAPEFVRALEATLIGLAAA